MPNRALYKCPALLSIVSPFYRITDLDLLLLSATASSDVKNDKPADPVTNLSGMTSQQSTDNNVKEYVR